MRFVRPRRPALFSTAVGSALALVSSLAGCDLDRSSLGSPASSIDPASDALDAGSSDDDGSIVLADSGVFPLPPLGAADANGTVVTADPGCDLTGPFAVRIEAQVRWAGTTLFGIVPIITPGSGKLTVDVLADLSQQGDLRSAQIRACGATTPDFSSIVSETYGVAFPDDVWEKLTLRWMTPLTVSCTDPGCEIDTAPIVAELGIDLPITSPWPSSRDPLDVSSLRDDDGDGVPGILLRCRGPKDPGSVKYTHPPVSALLTQRASDIMMAIRIGAELKGKLDSCDSFEGTVPAMTIDTRALGCALESGARCDPEQLGFVDDNLPVWKVDSAKFKAVRMPSGVTCADARAAMP